MSVILDTPEFRIFELTKDNGQKVTVRVRKPSRRELEAADMELSAVFNRCLTHAIPPRVRMLSTLREQGLWTTQDSERIDSLRQAIAKANTDIETVNGNIAAINKDRDPETLSQDEKDKLVAFTIQLEALTETKAKAFDDFRRLRTEIAAMLGHTADAKAEEAQRHCLIACVAEYVTMAGKEVLKVNGRVWDSIDAMMDETDVNLLQRITYEYIMYAGGMPSEWERDFGGVAAVKTEQVEAAGAGEVVDAPQETSPV